MTRDEAAEANPYQFTTYEVDREAKIATLTLSGPKNGNPAPWWAEAEIMGHIDSWENDDDVKVVIIRSDKDDFSVGHDFGGYHENAGLKGSKTAARASTNRARLLRSGGGGGHYPTRLLTSMKPTIAEVRGHCIEWGCLTQVMCDITIAANDAHFGCLGQTAGNSGVHYLPMYMNLIGYKRAREMFLTGRTYSGADAARIGLVNRSVPVDELQDEVWNEAKRIALLPIDGIVLGKAYTQTALESAGLTTGHLTTMLAWNLGLRLRFEEDEFGFLTTVRKEGVSEAVQQRGERYAPFGGYGRHDERPLVRE
jgi:enoyl-CoA hydratase